MSLKKGDTGTAVTDLQRRLTAIGYPVAVDGWFGEATEQALLDFQRDYMITAIGQAGPRTMAALLASALAVHLLQWVLRKAPEDLIKLRKGG
ncbi:MAG: peptidoglycan-binding domain-containing protein [Aeromonas veronii]